MSTAESRYQAQLIIRLRKMFDGCIILKNDPNYLQGVPDILLLWLDRWAALECKAQYDSRVQQNQRHYVELMDAMSFAAFIHPGNEEEVLDALQYAFRPGRPTRFSERQQVSLDQLRSRQADGSVHQRTGRQEGR